MILNRLFIFQATSAFHNLFYRYVIALIICSVLSLENIIIGDLEFLTVLGHRVPPLSFQRHGTKQKEGCEKYNHGMVLVSVVRNSYIVF